MTDLVSDKKRLLKSRSSIFVKDKAISDNYSGSPSMEQN